MGHFSFDTTLPNAIAIVAIIVSFM